MDIQSLQAGQGIAAIEGRIRQIESMLSQMRQQQVPASELNTSASIAPSSFANALSSMQKTNSMLNAGQMDTVTQLPSLNAINAEGKTKTPFGDIIQNLGEQYGVDAKLIQSVVKRESGFNPNAVSPAGAMGLMQLMPQTAKSLGVVNPQDPSQNLDGGVRYLKQLLSQFNGNIPLALAAYNAGPNAVNKHGGIPPYPETQRYVKAILADYLKSRQA